VWSGELLAQTLARVQKGDPTLKPAVDLAHSSAASLMTAGPWSVMQKKVIPPSGDKHDYVSLDKYYWPCNMVVVNCTDNGTLDIAPPVCNTTTGLPWVQHDGCSNPNMSLYDHDPMINMSEAVIALTLGWYYTNITDYATRAAFLLNTWFLDSATMMNPNLNYGHFIPGVTNGEHGALIDTHHWAELLDAVAILRLSSEWSESQDKALMNWFTEFVKWLTTSTLGIQEAAADNNHGVWYDVQVGFIAQHVGLTNIAQNISQNAMKVRIDKQITTAGLLPQEDARTKSWSYNEFCLDAFFHLAVLASYSQVDLWQPPSRIKLAFDYQLPFVMQQKPWPYPQIVPFLPKDGCVITAVDQCIGSYFNILRMAANVYLSSDYENDIKTLPGINYQSSYWNLEIPQEEKNV
jgi:hypothetical protein